MQVQPATRSSAAENTKQVAAEGRQTKRSASPKVKGRARVPGNTDEHQGKIMPGEKPTPTLLIKDVFKMTTFEERNDEPSVKQILKHFTCTPSKFYSTNVQVVALSCDKKQKDTPPHGGAKTSHLASYLQKGDDAFRENMKLTFPQEGQVTPILPTGTQQQQMYLVVIPTNDTEQIRSCCSQIMQKSLHAKSIGFDIFNTDKPFTGKVEEHAKHMAEIIVKEMLHLPGLIRPKIVLYKTNAPDRALIRDIFRAAAQKALLTQKPDHCLDLSIVEGREVRRHKQNNMAPTSQEGSVLSAHDAQ